MIQLKSAGDFALYLVRHGETVSNVEHRLQGNRTDSPLTQRGRAQAQTMATILGTLVSRAAPPDFVASPLGRARATMEKFLETLGLPAAQYATDARLAEIDVGVWSGRLAAEIERDDRERYEMRMRDRWGVPCPGGESFAMVAVRAREWFEGISRETVVVSHGGFGRVLRGMYSGLTPQEIDALDQPQNCVFRLQSGCVARIER